MIQDETIIGYWNDYTDGDFVTFADLQERIQDDTEIEWTLKEYLDWRVGTNLIRFRYDPFPAKE